MPAKNLLTPYHLALTAAVMLLALQGCALHNFLSYQRNPDYPRNETTTLDLQGLDQPVKVYLDRAGVFHIEAGNTKDLLLATGFMQARYRFFQMDMLRRFARGRLSELVGEQELLGGTTLDLDTSMRGWNFDVLSEQDAAEVGPQMRELLDAFTSGINQGRLMYQPLEYRLLGVEPEPWKISDSFAAGRLNAWGISHNWAQELSRALLAMYGGWQRAEAMYASEPWPGEAALSPAAPEQPEGQCETDTAAPVDMAATDHSAAQSARYSLPPSIVDEVKAFFPGKPFEATLAAKGVALRGNEASIQYLATMASNAWVLGGGKTLSSKPIVAADPHLAHFLPSIMIQQHIKAPGLDCIGLTMPGLPFVLMGHTPEVAWGMTSSVADVMDLYIEKTNPDNPNQVMGVDGQWKDMTAVTQVVNAKGGKQRVAVHRYTPNGVVFNDVFPDLFPDFAPLFSLKWNTEGTGRSFDALLKINQARTVDELRQAFLGFITPINNVVAGDINGDIAMFATGTIPVRTQHRGTFPVPGWLEKYQWKEYFTADDLPFAKARGNALFAHGNTLMRDPYQNDKIFHIDSAPSYRRDRIIELINQQEKHNIDSNAHIQGDVYLKRAQRIMPMMLADLNTAADLRPTERTALDLLAKWDFYAWPDRPEGSIFFATYRNAMQSATKDEVNGRVLTYLLNQRYYINAVDLWYDQVDNPAWDDRSTAAVETRTEVLLASFRKAVDDLARQFGDDPQKWRWGDLHFVEFKHLMGGVGLLAKTVNLPRVPVGGGMDSVWKTHFDLGHEQHPFQAMAGPVWRMVVDLNYMDRAVWVEDTGMSGWPLDPHYGDQFEKWITNSTVPMISDWQEIARTAQAVITLQ